MTEKSRRPPIPTTTSPSSSGQPLHNRSTSLSIARSPSVLASAGPFASPANEDDIEALSAFNFGLSLTPSSSIQSHPPTSPPITPVNGRRHSDHSGESTNYTLSRTISHPPSYRHSRLKSGTESYDDEYDDGEGQDSAVPLRKTVSFAQEDNVREYTRNTEEFTREGERDAGDVVGEGGFTYTGGFQSIDSKEMIGIVVSFSAVAVLALAAGLTTVYDWVF